MAQLIEEDQGKDATITSTKKVISDFWQFAKSSRLWTRFLDPKHQKASSLWHQLSHSINVAYPPRESLNAVDLDEESDLMDDLVYAVRHARAAYSPSSFAWGTGKWSLIWKTQKTILSATFGIAEEDIIVNTNVSPACYILVDRDAKKIVLSIRGTQSIGDIITNLNAVPCKSKLSGIDGQVHVGMLQSAYALREAVTETLVTLCGQHRGYKVVFTGHSLGGGVASLLGLMFREHPIIRKLHGLRVYAFASPCIVSQEFIDSKIGSDYITSVAKSIDLVTRLSLASWKKWHRRQDLIVKQRESLIEVFTTEEDGDAKNARESVVERAALFLSSLESVDAHDPGGELYPLGRSLWFVPAQTLAVKDHSEEKTEVVMVEDKDCKPQDSSQYTLCDASSCRYIFQELVVSYAAKSDHSIQGYLKACGTSLHQ